METLYKTRIKNILPQKIKTSCLICEKLFHIDDIHVYDNQYSVCIDCSKKNKTDNIIKICI